MIQKHLVRMILCFMFCVSLNGHAWANTSIGTWNIAVLMVDFSDNPGQMTQSYFNTLLFGNHPSNAPYGSLKDYYNEVSYGQLNVTGQVNNGSINWYRMPHPYSYYISNPLLLFPDAVQIARNSEFDFGPFDSDNDGYVDAIFIIHSGAAQEFPAFTSNDTDINTGSFNSQNSPVYTSRFIVVPEWWGSPGFMTIGVFAHEFGHVLGLPDLYETDRKCCGPGKWSLMAAGVGNGNLGNRPAHLDAWSKTMLGWVKPVVPVTATTVSLPPVETNPSIYKLNTTNREYFLLENRQNIGFDAVLPGNGLLIYHIDEFIYLNTQEWYPGCTICTSHYKVSLIQADDRWDLEHGLNSGDGGDPYPGSWNNSEFNDTSAPNSNTYLNTLSGVSITNISLSGSNVIADIGSPPSHHNAGFPVTQAPFLQSGSHMAFDGTNYMVVWGDFRNGKAQVYGARVSSTGVVLDPSGIYIADGSPSDIGFDGTNYLVLWSEIQNGVYTGTFFGTRLSTAGTVLDSSGIMIAQGGSASLAFDGTNYMVVWNSWYPDPEDIYAARIAPDGTVLDPGGVPLIAGVGSQFSVSIAFGGGNYFIVWNDFQQSTGIAKTLGSRMTLDGKLIDGSGVLILNDFSDAKIVYQGSNFLTFLNSGNSIIGVRIDMLGNILDTNPLLLATNVAGVSSNPAAFNGVNTLMVWSGNDGYNHGTYISPSGIILNTNPILISLTHSRVSSPAVVNGNNRLLVVWPDWRNELRLLLLCSGRQNVLYTHVMLTSMPTGLPLRHRT
jgi:M6 family metalloprotease-like protein